MGPKKKGKAGKTAKGSSGIVDGISISEMSREQLEPFVLRIQRELEREREERNFFQIERDKVKTFWEITRQQLEEYRATLRNKDKELEKANTTHQKEMKMYQQKIKHLVYGQHTKLSELKVENMLILKNVEQDLAKQELLMLDENRILRNENTKEKETHANELRSLFLENRSNCSKMRSEYENNYHALQCKYQNHLERTRIELQLQNEIKLANTEEQKNTLVKRSLENYREVYDQFSNFYCNIIVNNLALISILKERMRATQEQANQMKNEIYVIKKRNRQLTIPLKTAYDRIMQLEDELKKCGKKLDGDRISKKTLTHYKRKIEDIKIRHQPVVEDLNQLVTEKQNMSNKVIEDFTNLQKKIARRSLIVEGIISKLKLAADREECNFLTADSLDTTDGSKEIFQERHEFINQLSEEIRAFDSLSQKIEEAMADF